MTTCELRAAVGCLALIVPMLCTKTASAQAENEAAARALLNQGRELAASGRYAQACPKFESAARLYVGSGLLLNLGDCYEHLGRTASAWTIFGDAATAAVRLQRDGEEAEAKRRQKALEPRLSMLTIRVAGHAPQLLVKRDGTTVDPAAWGTPLPVDPGSHTLSAEAPNRLQWSSAVSVTEPGETVTVDVPELERLPASLPLVPAPSRVDGPSYWTGGRIAGVVVTGAGLVTAGIGGLVALQAVSIGNSASWVVGVGAAVAAVGLVVWLTTPRARSSVGTGRNGLVVARWF
jgi:hypothetical protein